MQRVINLLGSIVFLLDTGSKHANGFLFILERLPLKVPKAIS